ncbi:hypothetical protein GQ53DRAFT_798357 [Thozetella sp. PMI_491]|nr:hypothetical protein GQ53DRAFT_798357 [Thozetella sp. PMI_491]
MRITQAESHHISVLAGRAETVVLCKTVRALAEREQTSADDILIACKDDFQQTAAHIAAKSGQTSSIDALGSLFGDDAKRVTYFNMANRFSGDRPVHTAMRHGWLEAFRSLVRNGADPTISNRFGDTVMDYEGDYEPGEVQEIIDGYQQSLESKKEHIVRLPRSEEAI